MRLAAFVSACALTCGPAFSQVTTKDQMIEGLTSSAPRTRSLAAPAVRTITLKGKPRPVGASIDLEVPFDYDAATINVEAQKVLEKLGGALNDPKLSGTQLVIAGHTDARGGHQYNEDLSNRRAQAVREYLTKVHGVSAERLEAVGFGESRLKNAASPEADENRRVEVMKIDQ
jgi:outer membrane protein OmpA-like peptidoglycan-associated protein